jgi:transcription initiation factor TFIIF subunit alpha
MNQTTKNAPGPVASDGAVPTEQLKKEFMDKGAMVIPLVVTRRDMKELRHHIMRLQTKGRIDIQDEEQFTPPIRLHRRDPRAPPSGAGSHFEDEDTKEDIEESKERERLEMQKEERRKTREENQAKIAPTGTKKPPAFQKKTEQKFRPDDTPEAEKRRLLRYEETLPWHLEDFENKQTWVGTYESELSETHVMLTTAYENGRDVVQIVPLERWYKFTVKSKIASTSADQVDAVLMKQEKLPSFLNNIEQRRLKMEHEYEMRGPRMRTRVGAGDDDEGAAPRRRRKGNDDDDMPVIKREADADDIDFNVEEDFADDEEGLNGLFDGEETDIKEAAERLKRDQLAAAAFELRDEAEIERQEKREREQEEVDRILRKGLQKALFKREKNPDYDWRDEDSNPYLSTSEDSETDSETERQRLKEEEERKAAEQTDKAEADKIASGASTKGSNTPSGAHKSGDINKKKRPGSPNLSEASGNESSRKKHKKKHDKHADGSRKSSLINDATKRGAASGSDSEMTDAGRSKKHKLKVRLGGSPSGSPGGSRAGSPAAGVTGSRAGSPAAAPGSPQRKFSTIYIQYTILIPA